MQTRQAPRLRLDEMAMTSTGQIDPAVVARMTRDMFALACCGDCGRYYGKNVGICDDCLSAMEQDLVGGAK